MTVLLSVDSVIAGYGDHRVLKGASIEVHSGGICGLIGPNGAGKTTLFRAIMGLIPSEGEIALGGSPLRGLLPLARRQAGVSYVPQERNVFPNLGVEENLEVAYRSLASQGGASFDSRREYVYGAFPRLAQRRLQLAGSMSGGEQRTLAIAIGLMHEPRVLLLDEPTTGLSPLVVHLLMNTIRELNASRGVTIVIVEQNIISLSRIVGDLFVLKDGVCRCLEAGTQTLATQKIWEYL